MPSSKVAGAQRRHGCGGLWVCVTPLVRERSTSLPAVSPLPLGQGYRPETDAVGEDYVAIFQISTTAGSLIPSSLHYPWRNATSGEKGGNVAF